ncbi:putative nuclease HARBI1 [Episyrphus balteatus]|uniref:putative nuclease HARBI1 n=1 Tax=Episyrphus balteatus TaxID=286459 RepID=UPI00248636D9|nr:putative nuclease HARBI1 [Episyrphus balteatus]
MQWNDLLSSSSSSSSSSDDEFITQFLLRTANNKKRVRNFLDVVELYSDEEFREQFRLRRATAESIVVRYEESAFFKRKESGGGKKEISAKTQMYIFLWFAGNKNSYREVANLFGVAISSVYRIISNVLEFFFKCSPNYIKFPKTEQEKLQVASKFEKIAGFPKVLGCVDGCYIYIRKPANKIRSTYVNRHDLLSLTFQGICDADTRYTDVFVGAPSKIHDARIFQLSFISKELPQLCGSEYHILGDAAYPLREYLLTPVKDTGNMTERRRKYNKKLSQTRVTIENSFAFIKTLFRQLMRLDFHTVERMCKFILAASKGDEWSVQSLDTPVDSSDDTEIVTQQSDCSLQRVGENKRNQVADSF